MIDFENTSVSGLSGIENLKPNDSVVVFYTAQNSKISMDLLKDNKCSVRFIKVACGKQAVDTCIIAYLGLVIGRGDCKDFVIVSHDNGYQYSAEFLQTENEKVKIMVRETICENPNRINPSQAKTESEYDNGKQRYDTLPTTSFSHQFVKKLYGLGLNDHQINIISSIIHSNKNKGDRKNTVCNYLTQSFGQKRGLKIYNAIKFIII